MEAQELKKRLMQMPKGKRIAIKNNCLSCHKREKDLVGPSFVKIAKRYDYDVKPIQESIRHGSKGNWKKYRGVIMPAFADKIDEKDIKTLSEWIVKK